MENEERNITINWRVITSKNIRQIAQLVSSQHKLSIQEGNHTSISYNLGCEDSVSYKSDSISLFDEGGVLDLKKTNFVQITFDDYTLSRFVDVVLIEGSYRSHVVIKGEKDWISSIFIDFTDLIKSIKPQSQFIHKYQGLIFHIMSIAVGYSINSLIWLLIINNSDFTGITITNKAIITFANFLRINPLIEFIFYIFSFWFGGAFFTSPVLNWIKELWPVIEFNFGPEHQKFIMKRRKRIYFVITMVILPIIIQLFF